MLSVQIRPSDPHILNMHQRRLGCPPLFFGFEGICDRHQNGLRTYAKKAVLTVRLFANCAQTPVMKHDQLCLPAAMLN